MAGLIRTNLLSNERLDLPDFNNIENFVIEDINALMKFLITDSSKIVSGFRIFQDSTTLVDNPVSSPVYIKLAGSTLIHSDSSGTPFFYVGADSLAAAQIDLVPNATNYIEMELTITTNASDTRSFWDPSANNGEGAEFTQIVDTARNLTTIFTVNNVGFSGGTKVPVAQIVMTGANITSLLDRRELFFALRDSSPYDPSNEYAWPNGRDEPNPDRKTDSDAFIGADKAIQTLKQWMNAVMTELKKIKNSAHWFSDGSSLLPGVNLVNNYFDSIAGHVITGSGRFEHLTSGDVTWTSDILIRSILGNLTYTITQDSIHVDDEEIAYISLVRDQEIVGVTFDFTNGSNLIQGNAGSFATFQVGDWIKSTSSTLGVWRQIVSFDTGIPATATEVTLDKNYSGPTISEAGVRSQGTYAMQIADPLTVPVNANTFWIFKRDDNGSPSARIYLKGGGRDLEEGETLDISDGIPINLNDLIGFNVETASVIPYVSTKVIAPTDNMTIAISKLDAAAFASRQDRSAKLIEGGTWSLNLDGDELTLSLDAYIQIPGLQNERNTILAQTISLPNANSVAYVELEREVGIDANLTVVVADIDSLSTLNDDIIIIARKVSDGVIVGTSSFLLQPGEYLTLDGALAEINKLLGQLRLKNHETDLDKVRISTSDITLLDQAKLQQVLGDLLLKFDGAVIDFTTGDIFEADGTTPLGNNFVPFSVPLSQYFWYGISLIGGALTADNLQIGLVQVDPSTAANASASAALKPAISGDIKLGAILVHNDAGAIKLEQIVRLGVGSGSGGGRGAFRAKLYDPVSSVLPTGAMVVVDGISVANDDLVLFSNLASGNNIVYKASGVGVSVAWTAVRAFKTGFTPDDGDEVRILEGEIFADQKAVFNGTEFKINDIVRFFNGTDYWEQSSLRTVTLNNNTTDKVFDVNINASENWILGYSLFRGSNKETGHLYITSDGTSASLATSEANIGSTMGIDFNAVIIPGGSPTDLGPFTNGADSDLMNSATVACAQQFEVSVDSQLNSVSFSMRKNGSPLASVEAYLYADVAGVPGGSIIATSLNMIASVSDLTASFAYYQFTFPSTALTASTKYWIVLRAPLVTTLNGSDFILFRKNGSDPYADGYVSYAADGVTWVNEVGADLNFILNYTPTIVPKLALEYIADNLGPNATMKFFYQRWSNAAGGVAGIPNYSGNTSTTVSAAGNPGEIQFCSNTNTLDASPNLKWDSTNTSLDLDGLKISTLSAGITLLDNQAIPASALLYDASDFPFAVIEFSIQRGTNRTVGRLFITNNGISVNFSEDKLELGAGGISFSAAISGGNVELSYISTNTGSNATLKYTIRRWA